MNAIVAFCSCPDEASAERIANALVEERLAACVNRLPGVVSTYRWHDEIRHDSEQLLIIKTVPGRLDALRERIVSLHPYELPEVIAVSVSGGLDRYLAWIERETTHE